MPVHPVFLQVIIHWPRTVDMDALDTPIVTPMDSLIKVPVRNVAIDQRHQVLKKQILSFPIDHLLSLWNRRCVRQYDASPRINAEAPKLCPIR
jgi:hypothetical protein